MSGTLALAIIALSITMIGHLVAFVWWAATLTRRVSELEKDMGTIGSGPTLVTRMALLEQSMAAAVITLEKIDRKLDSVHSSSSG
jgi:hypothetical protein